MTEYTKEELSCRYCLYAAVIHGEITKCMLHSCCCEDERRAAGYNEKEIYPYASANQ